MTARKGHFIPPYGAADAHRRILRHVSDAPDKFRFYIIALLGIGYIENLCIVARIVIACVDFE